MHRFDAALLADQGVFENEPDGDLTHPSFRAGLRVALDKVVTDPSVQETFRKTGGEPMRMTPAEVETMVADEMKRWVKLGDWNGKSETFNVPLNDLHTADVDSVAVLVQSGVASAPKMMLGAAQASLK